MPLVAIKNFNALLYNKPVFDQPVKNKQEAYKKCIEISRKNTYTTDNLLDYLHDQKCILQQINFTGKSKEDDGVKAAKYYSKLFFRIINCNRII